MLPYFYDKYLSLQNELFLNNKNEKKNIDLLQKVEISNKSNFENLIEINNYFNELNI